MKRLRSSASPARPRQAAKLPQQQGVGLTKAVLELGGNNAFLVDRDADPEKAADDLIGRKIKAAGQACSSVNRAYVHADIADRFLERLEARNAATSDGAVHIRRRLRPAAHAKACKRTCPRCKPSLPRSRVRAS